MTRDYWVTRILRRHRKPDLFIDPGVSVSASLCGIELGSGEIVEALDYEPEEAEIDKRSGCEMSENTKDPYDHALLVLRGIRAGVIRIDETAEKIVIGEKESRLHLYTDDGSILTTDDASQIEALIEASGK